MATTVQIALFLPEKLNSPPYFENDQYVLNIDFFSYKNTLSDDHSQRIHKLFLVYVRFNQK